LIGKKIQEDEIIKWIQLLKLSKIKKITIKIIGIKYDKWKKIERVWNWKNK
jgi:hypothetical protein